MGFMADINRASQKVMVQTNEQAKAIVKDLCSAIIDDTPLKSGRLKGGWRPSIGSPSTIDVIRLDPTGDQAKAETRVVVSQLPADKDWVFYFSNLTPYGAKIEYLGWSQQAPHGMVRINMSRVAVLVRRAIADRMV